MALVRSSSRNKISLSLLNWFVLSFSNCWKREIVSPCVARVFSILSSLSQILEMDSLSFWMVFERLLGDVMELVALEWLAIEAHVFVGDLLYVLTDRSASFNSGSGFELNVISVLKRTSGSYEVGTSCLSCLQCSLYMVLRSLINHLVVCSNDSSVVYTFHLPIVVVLFVAPISIMLLSSINFLYMYDMASGMMP